jgi:hypothetical protein
MTIRTMVWAATVVGILLVTIVTLIGDNSPGRTIALVLGIAAPYWIVAVSLLLPISPQIQRWIWLVAGIASLVPSFILLVSGIGFFMLFIAALYVWAFVQASRDTGPAQ